MSNIENASVITTSADLLNYASLYIEDIRNRSVGTYLPEIALSLHRGTIDRPFKRNVLEDRKPAILEHNQNLILNLYAENLFGMPPLAFQGWLDLEIFSHVIQKQPELHRFNFQKDILPLFNVSGSAVQFMRYLIHKLELGLRQILAAEMILNAGHGLALVYYYYYCLTPAEEDKQDYRRFLPHLWLKAVYLSKKFGDFTSVCLLSRSGTNSALKQYWWRCHDHFTSSDRTLLENMVSTSYRYSEEPFAFRLVEICKLVKTNVLEPPAS
jgi:hypothetical protein